MLTMVIKIITVIIKKIITFSKLIIITKTIKKYDAIKTLDLAEAVVERPVIVVVDFLC